MKLAHSPWIVVLAGGSGTRLWRLTRRDDGVAVPKQFCSLAGGRSLLRETVERALQLAPRERIVAVVAQEHAVWWREQLADLPAENVLVQASNRGTAVALLLAAATILLRDPRARLLVMPSDHFVRSPRVLLATMLRALHRTAVDRQRLLLLGIEPEGPDTEYGWIVPGEVQQGIAAVIRFVEKPPLAEAQALLQQGAVWHSFLVATDAACLWQLGAERAPAATAAVTAWAALPKGERLAGFVAPAGLPSFDFARDLLPSAEARLGMLRVPPCGWTDLGTEQRLAECVASLREIAAAPPSAQSAAAIDLAAALRAHPIGAR